MLNYKRSRSLVNAIALVGVVLLSSGAMAQPQDSYYVMRVYVDLPSGRDVLAGRYDRAIAAASRDTERSDENGMMANSNLCVAYTKIGRFAEAESACTRAVSLAERSRVSAVSPLYGRSLSRQDLATALSNRGVLQAARGDVAAAARDFQEAASVGGGDEVVRQNLARLDADSAEKVVRTKGPRN